MTDTVNNLQVDIQALMSVLPVSGLEPNWIASLDGFIEIPAGRWVHESITFLEPPAGQHEPYIDPLVALEKLLRHQGTLLADARLQAQDAVAQMKTDLAEDRWVNFFDDLEPESPDCLRVSDFLAWLRNEKQRAMLSESTGQMDTHCLGTTAITALLVSSHITDFFERAAEVVISTPMFWGLDNWRNPWPLSDLPTIPPPYAMVEFVPGAPWAEIDDAAGNCERTNKAFMRWRESMRRIAQEMEQALGEPVYHFADLNCETDDDLIHRFLVLHWCCTWKPASAFVRYLLKVSGARDVDMLKGALIDPANYIHPFKVINASSGLEASPACSFDYLLPEQQKTVAILFSTPQARDTTQLLLAHNIGAHAVIIGPEELATDDWVRAATRYCRDTTVHFLVDNALDSYIEIFAAADEVCFIADGPRPARGCDLGLSDWTEELLWLVLERGLNAKYFDIKRSGLYNPETCLELRGVPARVAANRAPRVPLRSS